jgi:hypothetical protein
LIDTRIVAEYAQRDWIRDRLDAASVRWDEELTCQRWLRQSMAKRAVFAELYGDLMQSQGRRVLDVGGGVTAFTREFSSRHDYTLVDLMAHDSEMIEEAQAMLPSSRFIAEDWFATPVNQRFDVVIANDLFPNVDQRLERFVEKFLPYCDEMRLSLTYYPDGRWYTTKRVDADEIFTVVAWNGERTANALRTFAQHVVDANWDLLATPMESPYPNGRQVCLLRLRN